MDCEILRIGCSRDLSTTDEESSCNPILNTMCVARCGDVIDVVCTCNEDCSCPGYGCRYSCGGGTGNCAIEQSYWLNGFCFTETAASSKN